MIIAELLGRLVYLLWRRSMSMPILLAMRRGPNTKMQKTVAEEALIAKGLAHF